MMCRRSRLLHFSVCLHALSNPPCILSAGRCQNANWDKVNWVLNNKPAPSSTYEYGLSDDIWAVQQTIWKLLFGSYVYPGTVAGAPSDYPPLPEPLVDNLYNAAIASGAGFVPGPGQIIGVLLDDHSITGAPQDLMIEVPVPQLSVVKTPKGGTFTAGSQVSLTIVVSNPSPGGSASLTNVQLTDALPGNGGLVWMSASPTQGTCVNPIASNNLSCSLGTIAPQSSVTVTVTSTSSTPSTACQSQPNPMATATATGGLTATDFGSLSCTPPSPPTATCISITAVQGMPITPVTMVGSGGVGGPYTFSATGLPAGLIVSSSGTISGTPTVSGTFSYTVTVKDSAGQHRNGELLGDSGAAPSTHLNLPA
jgi:uncharacterized repeat protein (TIGR01451 family)